jgi:hypothetical protein
MTKFLMSVAPDNLTSALSAYARTATVEAEYGDECVAGSVLTMAHHGARAGQMAPCAYPNGCAGDEGVEAVGLSHYDLDSLGGCLAILGLKPEVAGFWKLAEFVDINGAHKLGESGATPENIRRLHAFWAWSGANKVFAPRDGAVLDVTDKVATGVEVVARILADDEALLAAGDAFAATEAKLNKESFVEAEGGVVARVAPAFVNHLYTTPDGVVGMAVVTLNPLTGGVTVSFADAPKGASACAIVQALWGKEAGGHAGIAGSPRGQRMTLADFVGAVNTTRAALAAVEG